MRNINYQTGKNLKIDEVVKLYKDAEWTNYTRDVNRLKRALNKSLYLLTAWDKDKLVGLIRVVGDGETIIYIQDILVLKSYQRQRIGTQLLKKVTQKYKNIKHKVLLTDNTNQTRAFYQANNYKLASYLNLNAFIKIEF